MAKEVKHDWEKGDKVVIKEGWEDAGKELEVLGTAIFRGQWWIPVTSLEHEDPDWHKAAGLIEKVVVESIKEEKNWLKIEMWTKSGEKIKFGGKSSEEMHLAIIRAISKVHKESKDKDK